MPEYKHALYSIEGIDGSGKTTVVKDVAEWLRSLGLQVFTTCEPYQYQMGAVSDPTEEALLLSLDRLKHCRHIAQMRGIVLTDRFIPSTIAYQGAAGVSTLFLSQMGYAVTKGVDWRKNFWLNVPVDRALQRLRERQDPELPDPEYLKQVAELYAADTHTIFWKHQEVDGTKPLEEIVAFIGQRIRWDLLGNRQEYPEWAMAKEVANGV